MAKQPLTQKNFDTIRDRLFNRIHKTGEEIKNDFPNILRRAIETEAWQHFTDFEGKPFANLVDWLTCTFPHGASLGEGKDVIGYEDALELCKEHPDVCRALAEQRPAAVMAEIARVRRRKHIKGTYVPLIDMGVPPRKRFFLLA